MMIYQNKSLLIGVMASFLMLVGWGCARTSVEPVRTGESTEPTTKSETSTPPSLTTSTTVTSTVTAPAPAATTRVSFFKKPLLTKSTEPPKSVKPVEQYVKAMETYQFRIQFDKCQGNPGTITLKEGLPILLDNRDPDTHVLKLGKQSFSVLGYDYVIAKAPTPGTYTITCNGGGAAEVHVQR